MPGGVITPSGALIIELISTTKNDKEVLAILIGIIIASIAMLILCAKAVAGMFEPRDWSKQGFTYEPKSVILEEELRPATDDELYEAGYRTKLVEEDGKLCIEKQNQKIFCNE